MDGDLVRLGLLVVATGVGVLVGRMLIRRNPKAGYYWVGVAIVGALFCFVGLAMNDGEYLGGTSTIGILMAVFGVVLVAAGLRLRRDAP